MAQVNEHSTSRCKLSFGTKNANKRVKPVKRHIVEWKCEK